MIDNAALPERAKQNAAAVFQRLGEAEAAVHQVPVEQRAFPRGGRGRFHRGYRRRLRGVRTARRDAIVSSPLNVGSGTASTAHGLLPVPAPATAALLRGKPIYSDGPAVELTTPTGAALAVTLARAFGPLPPMKIARAGYGAGGYDFPDRANVLRVMLGEETGAAEATTSLRARGQHRRPQPAGSRLRHGAPAGRRRAGRRLCTHPS